MQSCARADKLQVSFQPRCPNDPRYEAIDDLSGNDQAAFADATSQPYQFFDQRAVSSLNNDITPSAKFPGEESHDNDGDLVIRGWYDVSGLRADADLMVWWHAPTADALQDALISAFKRAESFRGDSAVTTWLHRIVVNACLDRMRRRKTRPTEALPEDEDRAAVLAFEPAEDPAELS